MVLGERDRVQAEFRSGNDAREKMSVRSNGKKYLATEEGSESTEEMNEERVRVCVCV